VQALAKTPSKMAGGNEQSGLDSQAVLSQMATASITLRDAISKALPVAPTQLMTVQIPGLTLNPKSVSSLQMHVTILME
jgi:hypothetical protein